MIKIATRKKLNYPFLIGSIFLIFIIIACIYPDMLSSADPYGKQRLEYQVNEGDKSTFLVPPIPPGGQYPWGTDHLGRDLKSLIIYGCKRTITIALYVAFGRLIIALPFAISAAYKNKFSCWFIKQFNILFNAFPLIILTIILSRLMLIADFIPDSMPFILILFGWSKLASVLTGKIEEILKQDFVEGEIAIGKSKREIALQNVIPHLIPSLIIMFFLEVALVLQIMAQIGIFSIIAGGSFFTSEGEFNLPVEFDWTTMLTYTYMFFGTDKMYIAIFPAAAFAFGIIAFNLFGEGLRIEFEKRNSNIITFIRKIPTFISPFRLWYEVKNYEQYRKTVRTKLLCYSLALIIAFFPQLPSIHKFDSVSSFKTIEKLSSEKYKGRLAGSNENKEIADYIAAELKSYGIKPYEDQYIHSFDINKSTNIKHSTLKINSSLQGVRESTFRKDYTIMGDFSFSGTFDILSLSYEDLEEPKNSKKILPLLKGFSKPTVILVDIFNDDNYIWFYNRIKQITNPNVPKIVMFITDLTLDENAPKLMQSGTLKDKIIPIWLTKEAGNEILRMGQSSIELSVEAEVLNETKGYNVLGYIPGTDAAAKDECILIGSKIDGYGDDTNIRYPGALEAGAVAAELEIAKKLAQSEIKPKNNIIFAFWDGSLNENRGSASFVNKNVFSNKIKEITYIDIGSIAINKENTLLMDTSRIFPKNKEAQTYINILKKNAKQQGVKLYYGKINSPVMIDLTSSKIQSMMLADMENKKIQGTTKDTIEAINSVSYKKTGQMLLDTIIDIARGK